MTAPRAVLFDLDGVLIDSYLVWFHAINGFAADHGYPAVTEEDFGSCFGQGTAADIERWFHDHQPEDLDTYYNEHFLDHLEHMKVFPGAVELLADLAAAALPTALVTNTVAPLARELVVRLDLRVGEVCGTGEGAAAKPEPDLLLRALERLGVPAGDAWMVGDSRYDRQGAAAAGVPFVGRGIDGDRRVENLAELRTLLLV